LDHVISTSGEFLARFAFESYSSRRRQRSLRAQLIARRQLVITCRALHIRPWRKMALMTCQQLAQRIEQLQPDAGVRDVARLCLLLANISDDVTKLEDDNMLTSAWREASLRLQAATDQHAAMTEELESLARSDPREFTPDQIWVLIRAIKVQGQILQLYLGEPVLDV
jgi:hypothetical protein